MSLLALHLGAQRAGEADVAVSFATQPVDESRRRTEILARDQNACRYCGFQAKKYQQLHFLNGSRRDWRDENLVTSCIFCQQCFMLDRAAAMHSGTLIWLPELSQAALNHLARAIYIARISPGPMADAARLALATLTDRREDAQRRIGTDDPAILASALQDHLEAEDYKQSRRKLSGLRLFPLDRRIVKEGDIEFNQFPQILAFWRSKDGPFNGALPVSWEESFAELAAVAA